MADLQTRALRILDELQRREARLLSWGMVDGAFTWEELRTVAESVEPDPDLDVDPEAPLEWLREKALLFCLPEPENRYRTRTAEGVRLFAHLRQILPHRPWRGAPELVADFRFVTLPRRYPDRYIEAKDAIAQLSHDLGCSDLQQRVALQLLGGDAVQRKLADFQADATARVLAEAKNGRPTATIICAGTGSGKTLAFYLPAFMHIAEHMSVNSGTQCLAIYPRIELLRDQLRTCVRNARSVDALLRARRGRPLSIGALYGSVPRDAPDLDKEWHQAAWPTIRCKGRNARRCPYFDCPECDAPLGWLEEDIAVERERLVCSQCESEIGGESLRLTRKSMSARAPDILFATTEMLNRGMANRALWPLFGIGDDVAAPALVLLDEVHTYGGVAGAQAGMTLRRWRHLAHAHSHFVGLSATLAEAPRFMAQLVGLYPNHVAAVEPRRFVTEGCEHIIALRGRPGTATLSTTIQSSMLLRRLLDAAPPITNGIAGKRIFVFTDNLDVTNRLYFQLGDAEGWSQPYKPRRQAPHSPLASHRSSMIDEASDRFRDGQSWDVAEAIGHDLGRNGRAIVSRTSSQDAGVEFDADMIVATASLEVGFDDPLVGGIVQHQAPRDPAAFVQRKGRAGRARNMRPWTVVVLSDWGRDRLAYRSYEDLFSPYVPPRYLPVRNRHVLRMQAALSFMDWLAKRTPQADLWRDLAGPRTGAARQRQDAIAKTIQRLLSDPQVRNGFAEHLQSSLALDTAEEAMPLLWEHPRSLIFSVWPTLLRNLESEWRRADGTTEPRAGHPLPRFVPRALFEDLNLPEVAIRLENRLAPAGAGDDRADDSWMPIRQALSEFAPGRVSRRYGVAHARDAHWVPPPADFIGPLDIESFCPREDADALGAYQYVDDGVVTEVNVFRPYRFHTKVPSDGIHERSDSRPRWHTQIVTDGVGTSIVFPRDSAWRDLLTGIRFHTHVSGNPIEMRRFTTGAEVRVRESRPPMTVHEGVVTYQTTQGDVPTPAALGFNASVDALVVDLRLPNAIRHTVIGRAALLRSVRVALFRDAVDAARSLDGIANTFQRRALAETYITLIVLLAEREGLTLAAACRRIAAGSEHRLLVEVLGLLGRTDRSPQDPDDDDPRRGEDFSALIQDPTVAAVLAGSANLLFRDLGPEDEPWLQRTTKATIGGALLGACQRLCPQVDASDLFVELGGGASPEREVYPNQVWLTEATIGGSGYLEAIQRAFAEDPRRFVHLFEAELEPSDFEDVDHYLRLLLARLVRGNAEYDAELAEAFRIQRTADTFAGQTAGFEAILTSLRSRGIVTSHAVVSAIALRLLRPGTSADTDGLVLSLIRRRDEVEERQGIELDDQAYAALVAADRGLVSDLRRVFPSLTHLDDPVERHALVAGLLWPRGSEVRRQSLAFWNPFETSPPCDRLILHALVPHSITTVSAESADWREQLDEALLRQGRAALAAPLTRPDLLREAALVLASVPTEADSLLLYPRVRAYRRMVGQAVLVFDLPEAAQ